MWLVYPVLFPDGLLYVLENVLIKACAVYIVTFQVKAIKFIMTLIKQGEMAEPSVPSNRNHVKIYFESQQV